MMIQTYWCPGPWPWQWANTCTREVPDPPPDPCAIPACVSAKAKFNSARNHFTTICNGLKMLKAVSDLLKQILATPIWVIIAMALIAAIVGGAIGVILFALIAIYGISWILEFAVGKMAAALAPSLAQASKDMGAALTDVIAKCPDGCRGDTSIPECKLG